MTTTPSVLENENIKGPFDKAKLDEFKTQQAAVREKLDKVSNEYGDLFDKSHENGVAISDDDNAKMTRLAMRRKALQEEFDMLGNDIKAMEVRNPQHVAVKKAAGDDFWQMATDVMKANDQTKREMAASGDYKDVLELTETGVSINLKIPSLSSLRKQLSAGSARSDDATGQDIVETETMAEVIHRLLFFGDVAQVSRTLNTSKGNPIEYPKADNTARRGRILADQSAVTALKPLANFESTEVKVSTVTSDEIRIRQELIEDSDTDVVMIAFDEAMRAMARTKNIGFTDGAANTAFSGVAAVAKTGVTAAAQTAFTLQELVAWIYSVNRAYRKGNEGNSAGRMLQGRGRNVAMVSDNFVEKLVGLLDLEGRPVWNFNARDGAPMTIYGVPYVVNDDLDDVVAGGTPALVGAFDHFLVRNSGSVKIHNFFDSNTATDNERSIIGYCRAGSALIGPTDSNDKSDSISALKMAA